MRLIDNLEELKVGDFISSPTRRNYRYVYEIVAVYDTGVRVKIVQSYIYDIKKNEWGDITLYNFSDEQTIKKFVRKIKKKKLKHKRKTYSKNWIIFKLNENEKGKAIRQQILNSLK